MQEKSDSLLEKSLMNCFVNKYAYVCVGWTMANSIPGTSDNMNNGHSGTSSGVIVINVSSKDKSLEDYLEAFVKLRYISC